MAEISKTLTVYHKDSYYRYHKLFDEKLYNVLEDGDLVIYERDPFTGNETLIARFRIWDYFLIEED